MKLYFISKYKSSFDISFFIRLKKCKFNNSLVSIKLHLQYIQSCSDLTKFLFLLLQNGPMRFYYRIHVPTTLKTILPSLKASSEPIRDSAPGSYKKMQSPELLDAVGLRPRSPREITAPDFTLDFEKEKILVKEEKTVQVKSEVELPSEAMEPPKTEERLPISPEEDTAVSQLLALSSSQPKREPSPVGFVRLQASSSKRQETTAVSSASVKPPTGNGGVFKVPHTMTKRFVFNGGKLVAVKPKTPGGKTGKGGDKTKTNKKILNGEINFDRLTNPLGLMGNGPLGVQSGKLPPGSPRPQPNSDKTMKSLIGNGPMGLKGGKLPPGSPRPPPNSEKILKTKYMTSSAHLINRLTPEVTISQNKDEQAPSQIKQNLPQLKSISAINKSSGMTNGQPAHRKEVNRLEQIVQNCLKKETLQKSAGYAKSGKETEVRDDGCGVKRSGTLNVGPSESDARAGREDASIRPADHVAANPSRTDQVDIAKHKESESSILKRKLNDPPYNRRPATPTTQELQNGLEEAKRRRLVTPDVSIELMANPAKEKLQKDKKREPSDLSTLTKRFLNDIQRMKKLDSELKINKLDQMCASTVKIEKVPAPPSHLTTTPKSSPNGNEVTKGIDGSEFSSENDQLFIDIRNKCEALKRKNSEPVSVAIERVAEDKAPKSVSQASPSKGDEPLSNTCSETQMKTGTHKKLPRLIEINAPPRPKLMPGLIPSDPKQKTGIKMTTVRKEVPIAKKEGPLVRRDSNGALDLSSGVSPPNGNPKSGNNSPYHRSSSSDKSSSSSSLSPLMTMTSFPMPDMNRSSPIRIPTLKPKTSPTPRPSSLSSSSPSPPAEPRTNTIDVFPPAYHQLYRHQMELMQSRILASQVNNNNWSRDPLSAKKFEDWMRNVMNLHPLMFASQVSPEGGRK